MTLLRFFLAALLVMIGISPTFAQEGGVRVDFPTPKAELDQLVPGQWYERLMPDGRVALGWISGPDTNPWGKNEMWFEILGYNAYNPKRDGLPNANGSFGGNSGSRDAPGPRGGSSPGPGIGGALKNGAIAGGGQIAIQGLYNALVMTPTRQAELETVQRNLNRSSNELKSASAQLDRQFEAAFGEAAKAVGYSQSVFRNLPGIPAPPTPTVPANETKIQISSAPEDFQREAWPLYNQLNSIRPRNSTQAEAQNIGNAALSASAGSAANGEMEVSKVEMDVARHMLDLLVGLDPFTGTARFGYEVFSGKNMIDGRELGPWERALSGVAFAASVATLGTSATVIGAIKGSLGVMNMLKGPGLIAGIASLRQSKRIADTLRVMGWVDREIANFSKFNRSVLNGAVKDLDYGIYAYKNWSPSARASFPKVMKELELSAEQIAKTTKDFGVDSVTILERRAKAIGFYNNTAGFEARSGRIAQHLTGIDFRKAVQVVEIKEGTHLFAWHVPGDPIGNYATRTIVQPAKVGVGDLGRARVSSGLPPGTITPKEIRTLEVTHNTVALESTANEMKDGFSLAPRVVEGKPIIPKGEPPGLKNRLDFDVDGVNQDWLQYAPGGEKQLLFDSKTLRLKP